MERCLAGDGGAWEALVARVQPGLRRVAARALARYGLPSGEGEASEAVQDALASALARDRASLRGYSGNAGIQTYLGVIVLRQVQKAAGKRRLLPLEEAAGAESTEAPPSEVAAGGELAVRVNRALEGLAARDRLALRLWMNGATNGEVARALRIPEGHARVVLSRARERARPLLKGLSGNPVAPEGEGGTHR